jgi:hypothetical protein
MSGTEDGGQGPATAFDDEADLRVLRGMWERLDPPPAGLSTRICMALQVEELEAELFTMDELVGARGEERVRTITFSSTSLVVMITISDDGPHARVDGWIDEGGGLPVELRLTDVDGVHHTEADEHGRFVLDRLPHGMAQLVFHPSPTRPTMRQSVVTPAIQI